MLLLLAFFGCNTPPDNQELPDVSFELVVSKREFVAGEEIHLRFTRDKRVSPKLWLQSAFGSTLVDPLIEEDSILFILPKSVTTKAGYTNWQLIYDKSIALKGGISILPDPTKKILSLIHI